jgi:hypothetical protein
VLVSRLEFGVGSFGRAAARLEDVVELRGISLPWLALKSAGVFWKELMNIPELQCRGCWWMLLSEGNVRVRYW